MECPKCGGKMIKRPSIGVYSCTNGKCYHNESINVMEYRERLDKVLEKFEEISEGDYQYKINFGFGIRYYKKEFRMFCYTDPSFNWCEPFSLKTVESILDI